jgi:hypothetical protein
MSDSSVPIRDNEMTIFTRGHVRSANTGGPGSSARTSTTPIFELGLRSVVAIALVAAAAIVSIAALGRQAPYGKVAAAAGSGATVDPTIGLNSYNRAEAQVVDREPCPDPGCSIGNYK